nr:hypothetical protein CFP56_25967 [Quercus suber]
MPSRDKGVRLARRRRSAGEEQGTNVGASGESWADNTKIGYLKNTFSNSAKLYTASVPKTDNYYAFSEEVERIITNLETTDQFKAAYKRWLRERGRDSAGYTTVTTRSSGALAVTKVDADRDTVMALVRTNGQRGKTRAKGLGLKWVSQETRHVSGASASMQSSRIEGVVAFLMEIDGFQQTVYAYVVPRLAFLVILGNL